MGKIEVINHPLIQHKLSILRRTDTSTKAFRELVDEIAMLMGYEVLRDLPLEDVEIETPITKTVQKQLAGKKLAIVPILRAGIDGRWPLELGSSSQSWSYRYVP